MRLPKIPVKLAVVSVSAVAAAGIGAAKAPSRPDQLDVSLHRYT